MIWSLDVVFTRNNILLIINLTAGFRFYFAGIGNVDW